MSTSHMSVSGKPATSVIVHVMYVYTANMPPKPTVPMATVNHTCGVASAPSSSSGRVAGIRVMCGTATHSDTSATRPTTATNTNADRQPKTWPSACAAGTPATVATDSPIPDSGTARPRVPGGARDAATSAATAD